LLYKEEIINSAMDRVDY